MSDTPPTDLMDYAAMMQTAMRGLVRQAIERAASPDGLPGDHHFYINFLTTAKGAELPADVLAKYPNDITVVLRGEQYRDLRIDDDGFTVTLAFGGMPKVLTVPWKSIVRFDDPSVQFTLMFEMDDEDEVDEAEPAPLHEAEVTVLSRAPKAVDASDSAPEKSAETAEGPKIVSLDQFRKK